MLVCCYCFDFLLDDDEPETKKRKRECYYYVIFEQTYMWFMLAYVLHVLCAAGRPEYLPIEGVVHMLGLLANAAGCGIRIDASNMDTDVTHVMSSEWRNAVKEGECKLQACNTICS